MAEEELTAENPGRRTVKREVQIQSGTQVRKLRIEAPIGALPSTLLEGRLELSLEGERLEADWAEVAQGVYSILLCGRSYEVQVSGDAGSENGRFKVGIGPRWYTVDVLDPRRRRGAAGAPARTGPEVISAPMPGRIVKVLVAKGQEVSPGDGLLVVEAMKMQNELQAPRAGRVEEIFAREGQGVEAGAKLIRLR